MSPLSLPSLPPGIRDADLDKELENCVELAEEAGARAQCATPADLDRMLEGYALPPDGPGFEEGWDMSPVRANRADDWPADTTLQRYDNSPASDSCWLPSDIALASWNNESCTRNTAHASSSSSMLYTGTSDVDDGTSEECQDKWEWCVWEQEPGDRIINHSDVPTDTPPNWYDHTSAGNAARFDRWV